jgi:Methyltransferase domain
MLLCGVTGKVRHDVNTRAVARYIGREMFRIPGYTHPADAYCFAAILSHQAEAEIAGGVAEIGTYYGRSFWLLVSALRAGEQALAADLFETPGQLAEFRRLGRRLAGYREFHVVPGPSEQLRACRVTGAVGQVRFFSIDGGHLFDQVWHDAELAHAATVDDAVIAFDDYGNPEWPDVMPAVHQFLDAWGWIAFAITRGKLYCCRTGYRGRYLEALERSPWLRGFQLQPKVMLGHELLWVHQSLTDRLRFEAWARLGLGQLWGQSK